jgi:replication factor C small subunit
MNDIQQDIWSEKYRPQTLDEIILPDRIKKTFEKLIKKKEVPNMIFSASAGTGKSTMAKVFAEEVGANYLFINASEERSIDILRNRVKHFASSMSLADGVAKIVIFDEADNMQATFQAALRSFIEKFYKNCRFIFTCNYPLKIMEPIRSRLQHIDFEWKKEEHKDLLKAFGRRTFEILEKENIDFSTQAQKVAVSTFIKKIFPDMRKILNEMQIYSIAENKVDEGLLIALEESNLDSLYQSIKENKFHAVRAFAKNMQNKNPAVIISQIFRDITRVVKDTSQPVLILMLKTYMVESAVAFDKEILLAALFVDIMMNIEMK